MYAIWYNYSVQTVSKLGLLTRNALLPKLVPLNPPSMSGFHLYIITYKLIEI